MTQQLLTAAPVTSAVADATGAAPLRVALEGGHVEVARCLMAAEQQATPLLLVLPRAHANLLDRRPLVVSLVGELIARLPLSPQDWQLVPCPCPGLAAAALPAELQRSHGEAGRLVARLPVAERARLRLLAVWRAAPASGGCLQKSATGSWQTQWFAEMPGGGGAPARHTLLTARHRCLHTSCNATLPGAAALRA